MPFITFAKEKEPTYINIDNVVGMRLTVESATTTVVKIFASRSELDMAFEFDTKEQAQAFMDEIVDYSLKASQPVMEATVTTTTSVPKRATARQWKSRPAQSSIIR